MSIALAIISFFSTTLGGLFALRYHKSLQLIMAFTAGVLLGLVTFDLLPEIFARSFEEHIATILPMIALVVGFLLFHIAEKTILIHHADEEQNSKHHPQVGMLSALALCGHSFLDGVGIGLGFQVSTTVGFIVAIAVISHDFADGLNTVTLMLVNRNSRQRALVLLLADALAPVVGALSTLFFTIPASAFPLYLGFFAGFLLYVGASDILPEAHRESSSFWLILLTIIGVCFAFIVTRFA